LRFHRVSASKFSILAEDLTKGHESSGEEDPSTIARVGMVPVMKRRERPTTARPAPPKIRQADFAAVEEAAA
jgi:hypothetical protein